MTFAMALASHKKILFACGLLLSMLLVGLYIFQLNHLTSVAYHIAAMEKELNHLKYQNAALQAQAFQTVSRKDLEALAKQRNFEKIDDITYLQVSAGPVAQQ